jgi:YVTN family beta-propeller protein
MQRLLFSTDTDSGTVTVYDIANPTQPISKIQVGNGPRGAVRFTKGGRGFVTNHAGNTISEIDAYSLREVKRIVVGIAPIGIAIVPGDRFLIVSNSGDNTVSVVDINAQKEVLVVPVGREPRHPDVAPDGKAAFIPLSGADSVAKIDTSELLKPEPDFKKVSVVARVFLGSGTLPYSAAVSPNGSRVVAANNQADFVTIIDVGKMSVEKNVSVGTKGARGTAFTPDGSVAFVSIEDTSEIVAIDMNVGAVVQRMPSGPGPRGLLFDAATQTVYASAFSRTTGSGMVANSISLLNVGAAPLTLSAAPAIRSINVGAGPCSVSLFER